jgi:hypothetical protein
MILHIVADDKFIDMAFRIFEEVHPCQNEFLIITKNKRFKYIKNTPVVSIEPRSIFRNSFLKSLKKYDMVILHILDDIKMLMLTRVSKDIKFVWIGWGYDYYDLIYKKKCNLYLPLTLKLYSQNKGAEHLSLRNRIKSTIFIIYYCLKGKNNIINRINYFSPVLYEDYELIRKSIPNFHPNYISWNYGTLEDDVIPGYEKIEVSANNILVGNSSTYENNHFDAFDQLSRIKLHQRKVIVPLSYGEMKYRDIIAEIGRKYWGDSCVPIVKYLPIKDYIRLIGSCSVVVMNHVRQQALGNIAIMMYLGAAVFLRKQNPIYDFFKKEGAYIYAFEDLINDHELINIRLANSEIEINREVLRKHWGRAAIHTKTRNLIRTVMADAKSDDHRNFVATTNDATCH